MAMTVAAGNSGKTTRIGDQWSGWTGVVSHPDAPSGSGGPGYFTAADGSFGQDTEAFAAGSDLAPPHAPAPLGIDSPPEALQTPKPANPPPSTTARSLGSQLDVQEDHVDVKIDAAVADDGTALTGEKHTHTHFSWPSFVAPGYAEEKGQIKSFNGKLTWKGTITIQTRYMAGEKATDVSCYGRGTTEADIKARDITLGFHEHCHQDDYVSYLNNKILPNPPSIMVGMEVADYLAAVKQYQQDLIDFKAAMADDTIQRTDQVGFTLNESNQKKTCYKHTLP